MFEERLSPQRIGDNSHGSRAEIQAQVSNSLITAAKECGKFIEHHDWIKFGEKKNKGGRESDVYFNARNRIITKIKDPFALLVLKGNKPENIIYDHIIHNILFPSTRYLLKGVTINDDEANFVFEQLFITAYQRASQKEIEHYLRNLGFKKNGYYFENDEIGITDVAGDNVLKDENGELFFIDPVIEFKKEAKATIDKYISALSSMLYPTTHA